MLEFDWRTVLHYASIVAVPGVLAITVHEVAHGWVAKLFGDQTAAEQGRLTLNPIKHVDPMGTILVPAALLIMTGGQYPFGWAKPVPVDAARLRHPRLDMIAVALAGPASNLAMGFLWALLLSVSIANFGYQGALPAWLAGVGLFGIQINVILAIFNLVPIPPLDGSRVLIAFLPRSIAAQIERFAIFGLIIIVALLVSGRLTRFIEPFLLRLSDFYSSMTGLA